VGIAQAILHEPDVLVLDEPTIGIDPIQVVETRQLIKGLGGEHTLIISTHILPEVSMICGRVVIIHEGQIVAVDEPANLGSRLRGVERIELDVKGPRKQIVGALGALDGVRGVERLDSGDGYSSYVVEAEPRTEVRAQLAVTVVEGGWDLLRLESSGMTLEEIFLRLTTSEEEEEA
jgi:ABC-2 type transport system ATP-binding protein